MSSAKSLTPALNPNSKGWWYDQAIEKVDELITQLEIPWEEIQLDEQGAVDEEAAGLGERLAKVSFYMVRVGRERSRVDSHLHLTKSALDHVVQRLLSDDEGKGTVAAKTAAIISSDARLKAAKIDIMEGESLKRALDGVNESLDIIWKTTSRILSARLREPVE